MLARDLYPEADPLWYKDAIIYQTHVKAFCDGNDDGIGDFKGLTQKLDYLVGLGVTAIWLLPFYPSPLRDDGYDIARYFGVHPDYGTLRDFRDFLKAAHRRGLRVITELVLNHTSDQHPWFQRARRAKPGSIWRDFYVWSDTPEKYREARIIFKDFEPSNWSWDPVAKAYYWHRFYAHQPDLNYDNPAVRRTMFKVLDNWLEVGVDGLRLDAVPYLFEREGTNCENLPETYAFLKQLRAHIDRKFPNRMLLAEANQWPEDAAAYFGDGDECHMAFHFPLMPRMFMAIQMEDRFPIVDILDQTPAIPETCQWALFLRNHDELTLEMVTDEERDYMYRVYARDPTARINLGIRRRLAPLMGNDRRKIELMNVLLFSMPGTPVIYYGDEIGMGDNYYLGDRNGVRTPMQWTADRNAGFSRANPQKLYLPVIIDPEYHYESVNVENQERNQASLLWWTKRMIAIRRRFNAFQRGSMEFVLPDNPKVLAFVRRYGDECLLVVVNLSRHPQGAELDLSRFAGRVPEEVVGRTRFPVIREAPYMLTLGSYGYFVFALQDEGDALRVSAEQPIPVLAVTGDWPRVLEGAARERLERRILPPYLKTCRWFGGKGRKIEQVTVRESIPIGKDGAATQLLLLEVQYPDAAPELYVLPLSYASGEAAARVQEESPQAAIARVAVGETAGLLYDGAYDEAFRRQLLWLVAKRARIRGQRGALTAYPGAGFRRAIAAAGNERPWESSQVLRTDQSNTSLVYANALVLKLYRRLDEGVNPDMEIGRFLTEKKGFTGIPAFAGAIVYRSPDTDLLGLGLVQAFVPNQGDAWRYTLDEVARYFERALARGPGGLEKIPGGPRGLLELAAAEVPETLQEVIGGVYLEMASLLGRRTAELHLALASEQDDPSFAPEPFTLLYQRSIYQGMQSLARKVFQLLRKNLRGLPEAIRDTAEVVLLLEKEVRDCLRAVLTEKIAATKIRTHGDYHLGQVLHTGNDFLIIDFEGEPARPLGERRLKRSPLRDVAGMIRSFHYAVYSGLLDHTGVRPEDVPALEPWAVLWYRYVAAAFLKSYLQTAGDAHFVPKRREETELLLNAYLLEKAVYEVGYELDNRPDRVIVPLSGIKELLGG